MIEHGVHWLHNALEERAGRGIAGMLEASIDIGKLQKILESKGIYSAAQLEDDGFIKALGLDPEKYRDATDPTGFNFLQALTDIAAADWADHDPEKALQAAGGATGLY